MICSTEKRFFFTAASWPDGPDYAAVLTLPMVRKTRSPSLTIPDVPVQIGGGQPSEFGVLLDRCETGSGELR